MKIHQLRFFVEVCNKGSITKAAETLHVTQPAISQAIIELEKEHGVKLFHRTNNGLELTREGSFLLLDAKEILEKIEMMSEKMSYLGRNKHTIRLGMPPMIAIANLGYVRDYKEKHPYVHFDRFDEASPLLRRKIADGAIDLCLATGDNSGLYHCETKKLTSVEVCACVSPEHELASRRTVSWDEIVRQELVVYKDHYQIGQAIAQYLNKHLPPSAELLESNNTSVHINLITKYGFCGFMYKSMADLQPGIVAISLEQPIWVDVDLVCRISSRKNRDIENFVSYLESIYREDGSPPDAGPSAEKNGR